MKLLRTLLIFGVLSGGAIFAFDAELRKLESALDQARTQTDMNLRSYDIAQYLDKRLTILESAVKKDLDHDRLKRFEIAAVAWRKYRAAEMDFEGDQYRGGSMQPLVHNMVYIRITKERIAVLSEVDPEGKYREK